jgi:rRNA small subunit pseudouridine methyltransferase Nep1
MFVERQRQMLNLVLAESALELVQRGIWGAPAVVSDLRRRGKEPGMILLDRSLHHSAMQKLENPEKRGRPDLVHISLLSATGTPLYARGELQVHVHTSQDVILDVARSTRIPKNYLRFRGLMEQALDGKSGGGLVRAYGGTLRDLMTAIGGDPVVGLSSQGKPEELGAFAERLARSRNPVVVVGGFPHGHFSKKTLGVLDELVRIHPDPLEAHVVISRLLYEFEKAIERINR